MSSPEGPPSRAGGGSLARRRTYSRYTVKSSSVYAPGTFLGAGVGIRRGDPHQAPIGIFRQVQHPTYDDLARDQVATSQASREDPAVALGGLLRSGDTWTVV